MDFLFLGASLFALIVLFELLQMLLITLICLVKLIQIDYRVHVSSFLLNEFHLDRHFVLLAKEKQVCISVENITTSRNSWGDASLLNLCSSAS
jgi:hypothetical protein